MPTTKQIAIGATALISGGAIALATAMSPTAVIVVQPDGFDGGAIFDSGPAHYQGISCYGPSCCGDAGLGRMQQLMDVGHGYAYLDDAGGLHATPKPSTFADGAPDPAGVVTAHWVVPVAHPVLSGWCKLDVPDQDYPAATFFEANDAVVGHTALPMPAPLSGIWCVLSTFDGGGVLCDGGVLLADGGQPGVADAAAVVFAGLDSGAVVVGP